MKADETVYERSGRPPSSAATPNWFGLDHTHDLQAESWVASANVDECDFPIQNLPLGVFYLSGSTAGRIGVAIGSQIFDVGLALDQGLLRELRDLEHLLKAGRLNPLMAAGRSTLRRVRHALFELLNVKNSAGKSDALECLVPMASVHMGLPTQIGDFTDFFTSIHHARRTGELVQPDNPVAPNFRSIPIGYHGRASTVVESGVPCVRPNGQINGPTGDVRYVPSKRLDFELEVGCYIGPGTSVGDVVPLDHAEDRIAGLCLVNDWSARDIQRWESQPLGPFLSKSFMTSTSPWVVTLDALEPFRQPPALRSADDPVLSPSLTSMRHSTHGAIDIELQVLLRTPLMAQRDLPAEVIARPNFRDQYWTLFQMITHQTSNGCRLRSGDLISSGTVSGPNREDSGCLLEWTAGGRRQLTLTSGEWRTFLEDGDIVTFRGQCRRSGFRTIGFGECQAQVAPART